MSMSTFSILTILLLYVSLTSSLSQPTQPTSKWQEIYSFGDTTFGSTGQSAKLPQLVGKLEKVSIKKVSTTFLHTIVVTDSGEAYSWGDNNYGQLGYTTAPSAYNNEPNRINIPGDQFMSDTAVGFYHSFLWNTNETSTTIFGFGSSFSLQTMVPRDDEGRPRSIVSTPVDVSPYIPINVSSICAGFEWSLYVSREGGLYLSGVSNKCYGPIDFKQLETTQTGPIRSVACGKSFALVLGVDKQVYSWSATPDSNLYGQLGLGYSNVGGLVCIPTPINFGVNVDQIAAGVESGYFLREGQVYAWGRNDVYQLGLGNTDSVFNATLIPGVSGVSYIRAGPGSKHAMLQLGTDKTLFGFGNNLNGELGVANTTALEKPQLIVFSFQNVVKDVALGQYSTHFQVGDKLYTTGGSTGIAYDIPSEVFDLGGDNAEISIGHRSAMVKKSDETLWMFGYGDNGQVGFGDVVSKYRPRRLGNYGKITSMATTTTSSYIVVNNTDVYCWGGNYYQQLGFNEGDGFTAGTDLTIPTLNPYFPEHLKGKILGLGQVMGERMLIYVNDTENSPSIRSVWGWGAPGYSALGWPSPDARVIRPTVHTGGQGTDHYDVVGQVISIVGGYDHTLFLTDNGTLYSAGLGEYGQLCNGHPYYWALIINDHIPGAPRVRSVAAGGYTTYILTEDNTLYVCGRNDFGQLGIPDNYTNFAFPFLSPINDILYIRAGAFHAFFVRNITVGNESTALVYSSGQNLYGELGLGRKNFSRMATPQLIPNIKNPVQVEAGSSISYILGACDAPYSGPNCAIPTCFGITGRNNLEVCSGQGDCIGPDQCKCFEPSFGPQCQFGQFSWKGFSGDWSETQNWWQKRGTQNLKTLNIPRANGERVDFTTAGNYVVRVNIPSIQLAGVTIGSDVSVVTVTFENVQVNIEDIYVHPRSSVIFIGGSFSSVSSNIQGNLEFYGTTLTTSMTTNGIKIASGNIQSSVLKVKGVAQLSGSITTQSSQFVFDNNVAMEGTLDMKSSKITTKKDFLHAGSINIATTEVINQGVWTQSGDLSGDQSSSFKNQKAFISNTTRSTYFAINMINFGFMSIVGNGSVTFRDLTQSSAISDFTTGDISYPTRTINMTRVSTMMIQNPTIISTGSMNLQGRLSCPSFVYSSSEGNLNIIGPVEFTGNLTLTDATSVALRLEADANGNPVYQGVWINVNGTFVMASFVLINLNGVGLKVNDRLQLFAATQGMDLKKSTVRLLGAPQKGAEYSCDSFGNCGIKVIFSFGSVENQGYRCIYLGNQKILELNEYKDQNRVMLTLTTPKRDGVLGFGFDLNGTISNAMLVQTQNRTLVPFKHQSALTQNDPSVADVSESKSVFLIGPNYFTFDVLVPTSWLKNQKYIYYAEINNGTGAHYTETYELAVNSRQFTSNCTNFVAPTRAEIYSPAGTGVMLGIYLILFILCIIFVRFRPMNTRGISPYLTLIILSLQLALEIRNYAEIPAFQGSLCIYYSFAMYPLQQVCFIVILSYFIKYFAVINLNVTKKNLYVQMKLGSINQTDRQKFITIMLKVMTSPWVTLGLIVGSYLTIVSIFVIIMGGYSMVCQFETLLVLKTVNNVELLVVYILTIIALAMDIIPNYRLILRCKWIQYVFKADPYYFRLQILLFIPLMLYSMATEIYLLAATSTYLGIIQNQSTTVILNTIQAQLLLLIVVIIPLVITMIETLVGLLKPKKKRSELVDSLRESDFYDVFLKYSESEMSIENILFWSDVQAFKGGKGKTVDELIKTYLSRTSPMEINVSAKNMALFLEKVKAGNSDPVTLFDTIEGDVVINLCDTYSRFITSSDYTELIGNRKMEKEMIEGK